MIQDRHMERAFRDRILPALLAVLAWAGLVLQLYLWLHAPAAASRSLMSMLGQFFGYFTIEANLFVAVLATIAGIGTSPAWLPSAETAATVYIAVVGLGYSLLLRHLATLHGALKLADTLLHDVVPLVYVLWWIFLARKAWQPWNNIARFLAWPILYLVGTLIAGTRTGVYLYPFVNAATLGYPRMLAMSAGLLLIFILLSAVAVAYSRRQAGQADG
jgi:hypothetical protein